MHQEERETKKKAKLEDFGGVHNAPSSFFDEDSIEDKMFNSKFAEEIKSMSALSNNSSVIEKFVTLKDFEESALKPSQSWKNPIQDKFSTLVQNFSDASIHMNQEVSMSMADESFQKMREQNQSRVLKPM